MKSFSLGRGLIAAAILTVALMLGCWPTPSHAEGAQPSYFHQNQLGFALGVKQAWTPGSLDNLGNQVPKTIGFAHAVYVLTKSPVDGSPKVSLSLEVGRTLIVTGDRTQWPVTLGAQYNFASPR